jgi:D-inositol-3-phosphate glycosyltransferase
VKHAFETVWRYYVTRFWQTRIITLQCMRIALFCHKFWPAVSGLCTYTGRLSEYLIDRGHEIRVFTSRDPANSAACEHVAPNLTVRRFQTRLANHPPYYFMPGLLKTSRSVRDVDIVHSVGYYFFGTSYGQALARVRGIPHVTTPVYTLNPLNWQRRSFDSVMGRRLIREASHVIAQSTHELELLRADRFDVDQASVIPFGVDSTLFEENYDVEDLRRRHAIGDVERVLLFVGKVMSPKGAFDSLEAVARLRTSGRKLRLIFMGEIHQRERDAFATRIRDLGLLDAVNLLGAVTDRREISRYYQLSDVVLFPSQYEQFGIVAVESAASGRPLVGTPVGIMRTLVPKYEFGLLHPFGDIDRFAQNLADVLDVRRYRENAAKHRREILDGYDWRTIAAETEKIYHRVLEDQR